MPRKKLETTGVKPLHGQDAHATSALRKKKLKIGIIGTGGIARGFHMKGYASMPEHCEMIWACDIDPEVARLAASEYDVPKVTANYQDVIRDPQVDAVSVTTPNAFHLKPTLDALRAGKHVLCEKPLAMSAKEARQMCRAAKENCKILQVGLQFRFSGSVRFMKDYIDAGNMGEIYYARSWALRRRGVPTWGVFIDKEKQGGGPLIDLGVHILDITMYLMGYPRPVSASGTTWDKLGNDPKLFNFWGDYDRQKFSVEDFAVGLIRFENGAVVSLESSFMGNIEREIFETQMMGTKAGATVRVSGDEPIKIFTEQDRQLFDLVPKNIPKVESAHVAEVQAFVQAILDGAPSPVPGEQGLYLNAIFDAIYKSSQTGKDEKIDVSW